MKKNRNRKPDSRVFVQTAERPSLGIEATSGQAWVGVDQQVGHGSADALFALTDAQYEDALVDSWRINDLMSSCWRGERSYLQLFSPAGGSWTPEHWVPRRTRMIPTGVSGEIWWHVDALGMPAGSDAMVISRQLAAERAALVVDDERVTRMAFPLAGAQACPRPSALIVGLAAGSTREQARGVLGDPLDAEGEMFALEGDLVRLGFDEGGLVEIALERRKPAPSPGGMLGDILAALGEPEHGPAFRALTRHVHGPSRRWAVSPSFPRRAIAFESGMELQVEHARVLSVLVRLRADERGGVFDGVRSLFPGAGSRPTREDVDRLLGPPASHGAGVALHRFTNGDLIVEYGLGPGGETPVAVTAVRPGTSVSHGIHRWRSGEAMMFLDALGLSEEHPLVEYVRGLPGVRLSFRRRELDSVEIGGRGYQTERFAAFVDGMPAQPTRADVRLSMPDSSGDHDDLRRFDQGWVRIHSDDGELISTITVGRDEPRGLELPR